MTTKKLNELIGKTLEVVWREADGEVWRGHHTLRKVCPKTLIMDNGGAHTTFRASRKHAIEIILPNAKISPEAEHSNQ